MVDLTSGLFTRKRVKSVSKILIILLIVYATSRLILFSLGFILKTETPLVVVELTSMLPELKEGDMLLLNGVDDKSSILPGYIIVFENLNPSPQRIVHRVIEVKWIEEHLHFITKGDNNPVADRYPVPEENVIGIVVGKVPQVLSTYILFTDEVAVKIIIVSLIVLVIALDVFYGDE